MLMKAKVMPYISLPWKRLSMNIVIPLANRKVASKAQLRQMLICGIVKSLNTQ